MKEISQDGIDYLYSYGVEEQQRNDRFGVRVRDGCCWALVQIGGAVATTFGKAQDIPVDPKKLPDYLRFIVEEHRAKYPNSDLLDVLSGRKSVQQALQGCTGESALKDHQAKRRPSPANSTSVFLMALCESAMELSEPVLGAL